MARIKLPHNWAPRPDQIPYFNSIKPNGRSVMVAHRRWGKDDVALHATACQAMQRSGNYWHMLPSYTQARKAIWEAINPRTGKRRIDEAFPAAIREATRSQDMLIKLKSGSTWQLVGSDNYNSLVGSPPVGVVFSEYAIADPRSWGYLRPILADNNGWAAFISTPRGKNHLYDLYEYGKEDPIWFTDLVTAKDSGVFTAEQLEQERMELISEMGPEEGDAFFKQEYMCSFEGAICGSYYGGILDQIEINGQICRVPYDANLPVITAWDLGVGDATGIWFFQVHNQETRVIDYYETSGEGLQYYAKYLSSKPYVYSEHIMPHDIRVRELGTGKSRYETAERLGIKPITICPSLSVDDGINAVRSLLPSCYFDKVKTAQGLNNLRSYHKEYDDKRKEYKNKPYHDFTSHSADAFRMFAVGHKKKLKVKSVSSFLESINFGSSW
jgi:hypothetical protein